MYTAKIFENGRSQAVRLPKECRFDQNEVSVNKIGPVVILFPKGQQWAGFAAGLQMFTDDFMEDGRAEDAHEERETL